MDIIIKGLFILFVVFATEFIFYNFLKPNLPRIPGDLWIEKPGITVYIPFVSALAISVFLVLFSDYFISSLSLK